MLNSCNAITDDYLSDAMLLWDWKVPLLGKNPVFLRLVVISVKNKLMLYLVLLQVALCTIQS